MNLSPIGIDIEIVPETFLNIQHYERIDPLIRRVDANAIQYANVGDELELVPGSSVTLNGSQYTVEAHLGGGTYGKVARVLASNGNTYALKVQKSTPGEEGNNRRHMYYLEAINHIVACHYSSAGECLRVPILYQVGVHDATGEVFFVMEMIQATARSIIHTHGATPQEKALLVRDFMREAASLFNQLWNSINFNHGDCKDDNLGISSDGRFKLLDFGFSTIDIPGIGENSIVNLASEQKEGRDLTQLAFAFYAFGGSGLAYMDGPPIFRLIRLALKDILTMEGCDLSNLPQVCFGDNIDWWSDTYRLLNEHDNPKGFPESVYTTMQFLTHDVPVYGDCIVPLFPTPPEGYVPPAFPAAPTPEAPVAPAGPAPEMPAAPAASPVAALAVLGPVPAPLPDPAPVAVHPDAPPAVPMNAVAAAGVAFYENVIYARNVLGAGLGYLAGYLPGFRGGMYRKKKLMSRRRRKITRTHRKYGRRHTRKSAKRRAL